MEGLIAAITILESAGLKGDLWLDGSFLTDKTDPEDVDLALRMDNDFFEKLSNSQRFIADWWSDKDLRPGFFCDSYLFIEFDRGDPRYFIGDYSRRYWMGWFGKSRAGVKKGIAVLKLPCLSMQISK
jgi:hypothetical protein